MRKTVLMLALCTALLVTTGMARAQDDGAGADRLGVSAKVFTRAAAAADFDDRDGGYGVTTVGASVRCPVAEVAYKLSGFDWNDKDALPFGNGSDDPWDTLHTLAVDLRHNAMIDRRWGWFVGGGVGASWEEEVDDSFFGMLRAGALYAVSEDTTVSFGVSANAHRIGLTVFPALSVNYRGADQEGFSATLGAPETWLRYRFDEQWMLRLGAMLNGGAYRLADDSTVEREGYAKIFEIVSALMVDWNPTPDLRVSFGPELRFARSVNVYNDDGEQRNSYAQDPALGVSASVGYSF